MPSTLPKVSVLLITYNQEHFIGDTLESTLRQGYPSLEIVVADDCSKDNTRAIIMEYHRMYPDKVVPVFADKNGGITANCNRGLKACTGEFIALLGGDDRWYPDKIEKQALLMRNNPDCAVSYHPLRMYDSATGKTIALIGMGPTFATAADLIPAGDFIPASSAMVRRAACPESGFDIRLPAASDWLFFFKTALKGNILRIDECLGDYRRHDNNASSKSFFDEILTTLEIIQQEHPEFSHLAAKGIANEYHNETLKLIGQNRIADAKKHLFHGLKRLPGSGRMWRWFFISHTGKRGIKAASWLWMLAKNRVFRKA